jgi:type VI protein secretion system component VasK
MFAFLKRTFVVLVGLLLITLFIWYAGPYFAFAGFAPLESEFARLVAIGSSSASGLLWRLMKRLKAYRASDRLLTAVVAQPQPQARRRVRRLKSSSCASASKRRCRRSNSSVNPATASMTSLGT